MRKIFSLISVMLISLAACFAGSGSNVNGHADNFYFMYNPVKTLDRFSMGFTYQKPDVKFMSNSDVKYHYPEPDSDMMAYKTVSASETGIENYVTLIKENNEKPLWFYFKAFSPNQFGVSISGTDLTPVSATEGSQATFPVTYDFNSITTPFSGAATTSDYITNYDPDAVTVSSGNAELFSVNVPVLNGVNRNALGYWFFANIDVKAYNIDFGSKGDWKGTLTVTITGF